MTPNAQLLVDSCRDVASNLALDTRFPAYAVSPMSLALLIAGGKNLPEFREIAEAARGDHRRQHGGFSNENCEACGWFDAAYYQATTGRELASDLFGADTGSER